MAEIKYLDRTPSPRVEKIFRELEEKARARKKQMEELERQAESGNIFARESIENLCAERRRMVIESNRRLEETYREKMKELHESK